MTGTDNKKRGGAGLDGSGGIIIWTTDAEAQVRDESRVDGQKVAAYHQCVRSNGACRAGTCGSSAANFREACAACAAANYNTCNTMALRDTCFANVVTFNGLSGTGTDLCTGTPDGNPNNGWQCGCTHGSDGVAGSCATSCS